MYLLSKKTAPTDSKSYLQLISCKIPNSFVVLLSLYVALAILNLLHRPKQASNSRDQPVFANAEIKGVCHRKSLILKRIAVPGRYKWDELTRHT